MSKVGYIQPGAIVGFNEKVYFTDLYSNALYSISKEDEYAILLAQFDGENCVQKRLFTSLIIGDEKIFCIPHGAKNLGVYDIEKERSYCVQLPQKVRDTESTFKTGVYSRGHLYLLGYGVKNVWDYNLKTNEWIEICVPESNGLFLSGCIVEEKLFVVSKASSDYWEIDCNDHSVVKHTISEESNGFAGIIHFGKELILVSYEKSKIYIVLEDNLIKTSDFSSDFSVWPHGGIMIGGDGKGYIASIGRYGLTRFSLKECEIDMIPFSVRYEFDSKPCILAITDSCIVLCIYDEYELLFYDVEKRKYERKPIITEQKPKLSLNNSAVLFNESSTISMEGFLSAIV